jgi:hypothetical protein
MLNLSIPDSDLRIGNTAGFQFDVKSSTSFSVFDERFSGIIGDDHEFNFTLVDSLGDIAEGATIYVSLYTPDGREIHGSPLTTRTAYSISTNEITITWTPSITGNYSLLLTFDGEDYWLMATEEFEILVRYPSVIQIEYPVSMEFDQPIPLSVTLSSGVFKIQDAPLTIRVWRHDNIVLEQTATTGARGRVEITLDGVLAGNLTIEVVFGGTGRYAPSIGTVPFLVIPLLLLDATPLNTLYVGLNCALNVSYSILGVEDWLGSLEIAVLNPAGEIIDMWNLNIQQHGYTVIEFIADTEGEHQMPITVAGLPGVYRVSTTLTFELTSMPSSIPMDIGAAPWIGGLGVIAALAAVVWKKVGLLVKQLPSEWKD